MRFPWKPTTPLKTVADYDADLANARSAAADAEQRATEISDRFDRLPIGSDEEPIRQELAAARAAVEELGRTVRRLEHGRQAAATAATEADYAAKVKRVRELAEAMPAKLEVVDKALQKVAPQLSEIFHAAREYDHLMGELMKAGRSESALDGVKAVGHPYFSAFAANLLTEVTLPNVKDPMSAHLWSPRQAL